MIARFICGLCEKTVRESDVEGENIIVVCAKCKEKLRRELNMAMPNFKATPERFEFVRRAA